MPTKPPNIPTGVITVAFTDIEGSTRLWAEHPEQMEHNLARHDALVHAAVADHDGYVFATGGDSFGVAFQHPSAAARFALDVQQQMGAGDWASGTNLKIRIGLHLGTTTERDGNYYGHTMNTTARVEEVAHGGQVILSQAVADNLDSSFSLHDFGPQMVRSIAEPIRLFQLNVPGLANIHPPLRMVSRSISSLPAQRGEVRGRTGAAHEIRQLLAVHRLVTLTGPGGIGKTRLAIYLASEESLGAQDSVLFVDLSSPSVNVTASFLSAMGLSESKSQHAIDQIVPLLLSQRSLLVVDNCEHVLDALDPLLDGLLDQIPGLTVLATSRESLGLRGERSWRVPPLALGPGGPAVRLFEERASDVDQAFRVDGSNIDEIVELCRRLDGIPLAIELAASRTRAMTVTDIFNHLDNQLRLLSTTARGRSSRQQTIEGVIDWSYNLCSRDEQNLLQQLAVFPSSFARDDVAGVTGLAPLEAMDLFESLVTKSLVQVERLRGNRMRYRLLESIRAFGISRHADEATMTNARDRHLAHFLTTEGAPLDLDVAEIGRRIQLREYDNIRAAADWAIVRGDLRAATSLTIGRTMSIVEHGGAGRAVAWLGGRDQLSTNDHLWALNGCAYVALAQGDHEQVAKFTDEAIALAAGQPFDAMPNAYSFAALDQVVDDPNQALVLMKRALEVTPHTPSASAHLPMMHYSQSTVLLHLGQFTAAHDEAIVCQNLSAPDNPMWGVAMGPRLLALLAAGADAEAVDLLASIERPARWGAHEWMYRLFDLGLGRPKTGGVIRALVRDALSPLGGDPTNQARDLLAMMAFVHFRDGDQESAERLAVGGLSGSVVGALAFEVVARIRRWDNNSWPANRRELGRLARQTEGRIQAIKLARGLAESDK